MKQDFGRQVSGGSRSARLSGRADARSQVALALILILWAGWWLRVHALTQLPPAAHYDEAANGILVGDIAWRGYRPIFITSYTGKEVFFFYLAAGLARLVGNSLFSLRLTSAFIGLLTVATVARLGRALFPRSTWLGPVAALSLATLFPHLVFSRLGFRAISQPLLQALGLLGLLIGWQRGRRRDLWLGGIALGLAAYTYLAIRLFPLVVAAVVVILLWRQPRRRWAQVGLWLGAGVAAALPLLLYFMRHPDVFWTRIGQVSAETPAPVAYAAGYLKALGLFFVRGDPYWRFNLPDRPLFTGVMALLWLAGAWLLLWRWLRRDRRDFPTALTPLLALGAPMIMLLPTALALNDIVPSMLRAIGIFPFVVLPIAYAATSVGHFLAARIGGLPTRPRRSLWPFLILCVWTLLAGWRAYHTYFVTWGTRSDVFYASDGDLGALAAFLDARAVPDETVYVASMHYRHPTLAFLSRRYAQLKWVLDGEALVQPARGAALLVYPHTTPPPTWTQAFLPPPALQGPPGPDNQPLFTAYALHALPFHPAAPLDVNWGNVVRLRGYDLAVQSGVARFLLYWEVIGQPSGNFIPFVHVVGDDGFRWAQADSIAYLGEQWALGERIVQAVTVPLPAGMPPALYRVYVGLFDGAQRLTVLDAAGHYAGQSYRLDGVALPGNLVADGSRPPFELNQVVAPGVTLLGYDKGGDSAETGAPYALTLWWQLDPVQTGPAETHYPPILSHLSLIAPDGQAFEWVTAPLPWSPPAFVRARLPLRAPVDLPGGVYRLSLSVAQPDQPPTLFDLGPLTLIATPRSFSPPPFDHPAGAAFGDEIVLLGYTLTPRPDGWALTLVWRALAAPAQDYTVFVHRLRADGTCCLWQSDAAPQQGSYPTTRWLPDEVVVDAYVIPAAPSEPLNLEVGLYLPETGQRLPALTPDQPARDFFPIHN